MKRLIYAPKVYIFIRSSNLGGRVYDVSSDVVSGSVTQNCDDLSTAKFYLRNRYQKWLRDPASGNKSIFLPMDMVTIWLQRISGHPIQVFTGYLDSTPYYQGYPGNAYFEASCTLKKLAYTWFDPGLPFFQQWVNSQDGWAYDVSSGEAINPKYQATGQPVTDPGPGNLTATMHDGGFASLLGRFLTEVAGWDPDDVLISQLPPDLPQLAAQLYSKIESATATDLQALSDFMNQALGVGGWSGTQTDTDTKTTTAAGTQIQQTQAQKIASQIATEASKANVPLLVCVFAAYVLTGMDAKYQKRPGKAKDNNWGYGLYALQPPPMVTPDFDDPFYSKHLIDNAFAATIEGMTATDLLDVKTSTQVFCKLLNKNQGAWVQGARKNDIDSIVKWIEAALGRKLPSGVDKTAAFAKTKQIAQASVVSVPKQSPSVATDPSDMGWDDVGLQKLLTDRDKQIINGYYKESHPWLAGILFRAKQISKNMQISNAIGLGLDSIVIIGAPSDLTAFYKSLQGDDTLDQVIYKVSDDTRMLAKGKASSLTSSILPFSGQGVYVQQSKKPQPAKVSGINLTSGDETTTTVTDGTTTTTTTTTTHKVATFEQLAAFSANSAFAANFAFPADYLLSTNLTGDRALMNDISALDGVKQFCQASLRSFRSLPDGRFLAFYPDYFGARRDAYWKIYNIEIIDFGIQLNDEALATHVYVVGDTGMPDGQIDDIDKMSTRGVATITQGFMLESFISPYDPSVDPNAPPPPLGRLIDAQHFLAHYGARPHEEDQPLIRNTLYEFLMAWQRFMQLWASQFATNATFTFQPEVMAGGLIAFPDHGIQMYCESVTHNFDYESGFSTSAVLSSPSLLAGKQKDKTFKPGFALAGGANTVGAAG